MFSKWTDDPLVPLQIERLEAARNEAGLSVSGLAEKAGLGQQTLQAMRSPPGKRKQKRCRRSYRDKIAEALGFPPGEGSLWLGGEISHLTEMTQTMSGAVVMQATAIPTGIDLARYRLIRRCRESFARDANLTAEASEADKGAAHAKFFGLKESLTRLTKAFWWRGQLLKPFVPHVEWEPDETGEEFSDEFKRMAQEFARSPFPTDEESLERIEHALINALHALLQPWFDGAAELDIQNVLSLANRGWWERFPEASNPRQDEEGP